MESCRIYLSGGMCSLSFEEQTRWRKQFSNAIKFGDYNYIKKPYIFDPTQYYNFTEVRYKSEKEVMNFELNALRHSDLIVVNFNDPSSLGTCAELAIGHELRIPIIGINKDGVDLHPWLCCFCDRMCNDIREAVEHVTEFYLN